jgi:hypothetical protein
VAGDPEVLIVADPNDELACQLHEAVSRRGHRCAILDGPSAARLFTIRVDDDGAHVFPDVPLFIRASAWSDDKATSEDERFLRAEAFATLWAAAALCKSPVINRPTPAGSVGRLTISAIASRMGACTGSAYRELHVSDPAIALGKINPPIWGEDIDFRTRELSALRANVPARVRSVTLDAGYETISIVGARAFAATNDPRTRRAGLLARCIEIVARFDLHFATVTWMVGDDGAVPVRLNAEPSAAELRTCLDAVLEGLCQDLHP